MRERMWEGARVYSIVMRLRKLAFVLLWRAPPSVHQCGSGVLSRKYSCGEDGTVGIANIDVEFHVSSSAQELSTSSLVWC